MKGLIPIFMLAAIVLLTGCTIKESLSVTSTILIKVPKQEISGPMQAYQWHFRHVLQGPASEGGDQWYVAWNNEKPLRTGLLTPYWLQLNARAPEIADATKAALGAYPILIEPNRTFTRFAPKQELETKASESVARRADAPATLAYGKKSSSVWPVPHATAAGWPDSRTKEKGGLRLDASGKRLIDPVWYLRDRYTQLATARDRVGTAARARTVRIGHLDNGYDDRHAALPEHLLREKIDPRLGSLSNAVGRLEYEQDRSRAHESARSRSQEQFLLPPGEPGTGKARGTHGIGTMGILAGGRVSLPPVPGKIAGYTGYLGGAPHAEVVSVRVAPWVISLNTAELAYAIDYASRRQSCDVLSLSHGGSPTQAWVDAVNAAYERGTAIFAAESDFFSIVGNPFRPNGLILPASPVYPASFRRVIGVTGVAADGRNYARNSYSRLLLHPFSLTSWASRGSYGADGISTVVYRPAHEPDVEETEALGVLRANPIAAYSPNIPWLATRKVDGVERADAVDLDGSGTSAATPQVAAAAALWLQKNRRAIESQGHWHDWRKAEAVYYALLRSADRRGHEGADFYLGAGTLKASDALDISYRVATGATAGKDLRFGLAPPDHFDGAQSTSAFFGFGTFRHVREAQRAHLWQESALGEDRASALTRLYYNLGLLRQWHGGHIPLAVEQPSYWTRAGRLAKGTPAPDHRGKGGVSPDQYQ